MSTPLCEAKINNNAYCNQEAGILCQPEGYYLCPEHWKALGTPNGQVLPRVVLTEDHGAGEGPL